MCDMTRSMLAGKMESTVACFLLDMQIPDGKTQKPEDAEKKHTHKYTRQSCGLACGKILGCEQHMCARVCHQGPCESARESDGGSEMESESSTNCSTLQHAGEEDGVSMLGADVSKEVTGDAATHYNTSELVANMSLGVHKEVTATGARAGCGMTCSKLLT